jgi:hypothetical protein
MYLVEIDHYSITTVIKFSKFIRNLKYMAYSTSLETWSIQNPLYPNTSLHSTNEEISVQ